jgi:hypothetical protein
MSQGRIAFSSLALSAIFAVALAMPSADAQPRPGQPGQLAPGPGQPAPPAQRGPTPGQPPQPAPPKPYKEIAVTLPQSSNDPSFEAFLKQLDDIAMKKDRAALARLVGSTNFFWIGEVNGREGDKANKRKSGIDNLAAATDLDDKEGSGWVVIAQAAKETSLEPMQQKRGVFCSPAGPIFDDKAAEQLGKATGTTEFDWAFPTKPGIDDAGRAACGQPGPAVAVGSRGNVEWKGRLRGGRIPVADRVRPALLCQGRVGLEDRRLQWHQLTLPPRQW